MVKIHLNNNTKLRFAPKNPKKSPKSMRNPESPKNPKNLRKILNIPKIPKILENPQNQKNPQNPKKIRKIPKILEKSQKSLISHTFLRSDLPLVLNDRNIFCITIFCDGPWSSHFATLIYVMDRKCLKPQFKLYDDCTKNSYRLNYTKKIILHYFLKLNIHIPIVALARSFPARPLCTSAKQHNKHYQ